VTHEINGRKILSVVEDKLQLYRDRTQNIMQNSKVVIIQFEPRPSTIDPYLLGKYEAANVSTRQKQKLFEGFLGCKFENPRWGHDASLEYCRQEIEKYNRDPSVKAIIIQTPIPKKAIKVKQEIAPEKDIDAMSDKGLELWKYPATSDAILRVLDSAIEPKKKVAVIGSQGFVGKQVANYLKDKKISVLEVDAGDEKTMKNKGNIKIDTDIIIITSTTGAANSLNEEYILPRHKLVIDCGFAPMLIDGKMVVDGDVSKSAYSIPQFITPVPGGIGPMEMAVLGERFTNKILTEANLSPLKPWQLTRLENLTPEDLRRGNYLTETSLQEIVTLEQSLEKNISKSSQSRSLAPEDRQEL
jgi:methylenetetrahydrofolate dehydrogenase (NADP+) / methenyltetrahydrofolate cyclohydrolase